MRIKKAALNFQEIEKHNENYKNSGKKWKLMTMTPAGIEPAA